MALSQVGVSPSHAADTDKRRRAYATSTMNIFMLGPKTCAALERSPSIIPIGNTLVHALCVCAWVHARENH